MLGGEPKLGPDDDLFEAEAEAEEVTLKRVAEADPDNELECAGGGIESSVTKKPHSEPFAPIGSDFISPVKPSYRAVSPPGKVTSVHSPGPALSPPAQPEPQRGTASFWIVRMKLATILSGEACNAAKSQALKLLPKLTDDAQVRRLREHLALRERALRFIPDAVPPLSSYPGQEVAEDIDAFIKAGVDLPLCTKMAIFRYHAGPMWDTVLREDPGVAGEKDQIAVIKQLLRMHILWLDGKSSEFNHRDPRLVDIGLTDHSLADVVLHEFWSTKVCKMISTGAQSGMLVTFCEMLLDEWVLTEEAIIGEECAQMFLDSKRVAYVLLQLLGGAITANTSPEVFSDASEIEQASFLTEGDPSLFTTVGQSINESVALKGVLQALSQSSKTMIARAPILTKQMAALEKMPKQPSQQLCAHLKQMFDELPDQATTLIDGATDEYEAMALSFATETATSLLDDFDKGDTTLLGDGGSGAILGDYRDLFKSILQAIPTEDSLRRIAKRISAALSASKAFDTMNKISACIDDFIATKTPPPDELILMLRPVAQDSVSTTCVLKFEALADHLCAQLAPRDLQADQLPAELQLLNAVLMFLPADSQSKFKHIAETAEFCIQVKSKLVVIEGFGDGAELWKSASREAALTDLMRVVVRGVAAHRKAPPSVAPQALPFAADLFASSEARMNEWAQKLVEHYHARAVSSYEDVVAANDNDPLLAALGKLGGDAEADAIIELAKHTKARFEPSGLHSHLKRAAEETSCHLWVGWGGNSDTYGLSLGVAEVASKYVLLSFLGLGPPLTPNDTPKDITTYKNKAQIYKLPINDTASESDLTDCRLNFINGLIVAACASGATGFALRNKMLEPQKLLRSFAIAPAKLHKGIRSLYQGAFSMERGR